MINPNANASFGCHYILCCVIINFVLKETKQILQINFILWILISYFTHQILIITQYLNFKVKMKG